MRRGPSFATSAAAQPLDYLDFVKAKIITLPPLGLPMAANDIHPVLKPHQQVLARWAIEGGRRAIFAAFGLGKSLIQLEIMRQIGLQIGGRQLIVVPLTVLIEFKRDALLLGLAPTFIRTSAEALLVERGLFLTNYESVREGKIDLAHDAIFRLYRGYSANTVYDHEHHVALTESMERKHALPTDFALLPPQSWHPDVWSDVARMLGANTAQAAKGREQHLCPLPFDIVDRAICGWSAPGELIYDPFGGLMTVPLRAVKHGRRGAGVELNAGYFADGVRLLREQDAARATPSLFDLLEVEAA